MRGDGMVGAVWRWLMLVAVALVLLQMFFVVRIAMMRVLPPRSTAFERSEVLRVVTYKGGSGWQQRWVSYAHISDHLKRAVIACEDDGFVNHDGVDWNAVEKAWQKNIRATQQASSRARPASRPPKVYGGSTITQQLAKNLFLSGERTLPRKGQELFLTMLLEAWLDKPRILEIYLNHVEWGEGVFGAEAASLHYFGKPASQLTAYEAARLAVMLPRPKYFEKLPHSSYVAGRASLIVGRMARSELP